MELVDDALRRDPLPLPRSRVRCDVMDASNDGEIVDILCRISSSVALPRDSVNDVSIGWCFSAASCDAGCPPS